MVNIRKFLQGVGLIPVSSTAVDSKGELEVLDASGKLNFHNGTTASPVVTEAHASTLTNKTIDADSNTITNIENADIKAGAAIDASKLADGSVSNAEFQYLANVTSDIQTQLNATASQTSLDNHINDASDAHDASAISNVPAGSIAATDVQAAINELDSDIQGHITDSADAHDASAISNVPSGNLAATDVQAALDELQTDVDTRATSSALTTHTGASSGVHGVTGSVVGTTDTQTLTNKTLTTPATDVVTMDGQASTPSNPSAGNYKLYFKDDDKLYKLTSGGTETEIGAGGGGSGTVNSGTGGRVAVYPSTGTTVDDTYQQNSNDISIAVASHPSLASARTYTVPEAGANANFVMTEGAQTINGVKTLGNDLDVNDKNLNKISYADYKEIAAPSTPSTGYVRIYAKSDGNLYQKDDTGTEIRLSGSGGIATEWQSYTPTFTNFGSTSNVEFKYRRVGDSLEIHGRVTFASGGSASPGEISLPSGLTIDSSKLTVTKIVGVAGHEALDGNAYFTIGTGGNTYVGIGGQGNTGGVSSAYNGNDLSGYTWQIHAQGIPISGWAAASGGGGNQALYVGYHGTGSASDYWTTSSSSYVDPTQTGTPGLTQRFNDGMGTVTTASSSRPGITLTAPYTGTIKVTANVMFQGGSTDSQFRLVEASGPTVMGTVGTYFNSHLGHRSVSGFYSVTSSSSYTFTIQMRTASTTVYIGGVPNDGIIEWIVEYVK